MVNVYFNLADRMLRFNRFVRNKWRHHIEKHRENLIEALYLGSTVKVLSGTAVWTFTCKDGRVGIKRSNVGLVTTLFSFTLFLYCSIITIEENQTLMRKLHPTRLKQYGDLFEKLIALMYTAFVFYKLAIQLSRWTQLLQLFVDIDELLVLSRFDLAPYYRHTTLLSFFKCFVQLIAAIAHLVSLWVTHIYFEKTVPIELMVQVTYYDALSLLITSQYCFYQVLFSQRYKILALLLQDMDAMDLSAVSKTKKSAEKTYLYELLQRISIMYGMLYEGSVETNTTFGCSLILTFATSFFYILLDMFYFMETTAAEMFSKDQSLYLYFVMYIAWEIVYSFTVVFLHLRYCEKTYRAARKVMIALHKLLSRKLGTGVSDMAMKLSQQMLHQSPKFTSAGLFDMKYGILLTLANNVTTYLIILSDFATKKLPKPIKPWWVTTRRTRETRVNVTAFDAL